MSSCCIQLSAISAHEKKAILRALDAYQQYASKAKSTHLEPRRVRLDNLSDAGRHFLKQELAYDQMLDHVDEAIHSNSQIASGIFDTGCLELGTIIDEISTPETWSGTATDFDCSVARSCIRAMFRDWSSEGAAERNAAHEPILRCLNREFGQTQDKASIRVLVPGVGLGRLVHSIAELGLYVEGNDVSYHTLLARMNLFTSGARQCSQATLYPWALSFSNHISRQHQLQKVTVPDTHPDYNIRIIGQDESSSGKENNVVFTTGGFEDLYGGTARANKFSAVTTCYFVDTAVNFLDYVDTAWNCLKEGGLWINIGPLLWNTEENGPAGSAEGDSDEQEAWNTRQERTDGGASVIELTAEEVILVLQRRGFVVEKHHDRIGSSSYVGNKSSMLNYTYNMAFWVARKQAKHAVKL